MVRCENSLQFLLDVMGYAVATFPSAHAFLQAERQQFACLILDHHMPQITGLELCEKLRADRADIPILLITGSLSAEVVRGAAELGIRVLEKPPGEDALLDFIDGAQPDV